MGLSVSTTPFGAPALDALAAVLGELKGDPLAPVTVIVPSTVAGLHARRRLGSRAIGGRSPGLAAISFLPLTRLAELMGAPRLAAEGRRPVTVPLLTAAVSAALASHGGQLGSAARHPATERAVLATLADLRAAPGSARAALRAQGGRVATIAAVADEVDRLLAGTYDETALYEAASAVAATGAPADLGSVAVWLPPADLPDPAVRFLEALADTVAVRVIIGCTGDAGADATTQALIARLDATAPAGSVGSVGPAPVGSAVLAAPDADEEVRAAVRRVAAHLEAGGPLHRVAVLHATPEPYALAVQEHLTAAGLPFAAPSRRRLADTLVARALLALLALPEGDFAREDVLALLDTAPVLRADGERVPVTRWDRRSREAGVVRGLDQWIERGAWARDAILARCDEERAGEARPNRLDALERDADDLADLVEFVTELDARLSAQLEPGWAGLVAWARELLKRYLGGENRRGAWPDAEIEAAAQVERVLDAVAELDAIAGPPPTVADLHRILGAELDRPAGRVGRFGEGVIVGPLELAAGLDLDLVVVVGLVEGRWPHRPGDDPLVPDRVRARIPGLAVHGVTVDEQHRRLLVAIAAGAEVVLGWSRGDLRTGRAQLPSRWVLDTATVLAGRPVLTLDEVDPVEHPWFETVHSFPAGLRGASVAAGPADRDLRSLVRHVDLGGDAVTSPLAAAVPEVARGLAARTERRAAGFSRFDGNVASVFDDTHLDTEVLSPTRLEAYASCPMRYLLQSVLRVGEVEKPEDIHQLADRERGSLVHQVLERFLAEVLARPAADQPGPDDPWTEADHDRIEELASEGFAEVERRGLTGRPVLWRHTMRAIRRDLHLALRVDDEHRHRRRARPAGVELGFGFDGEPPVDVDLGRRTVRFRGRADRVDRTDDGGVVVIDYKTGKADPYKALDDGDPVQAGTKLQLPIYALAARAHTGATGAAHALYQFPSQRGGFAEHGYEVDEARLARFREVVGTLTDGISAGHFPPRPGDWDGYFRTFQHCSWCPYDRLCPAERDDQWHAARSAPELAPYVALVEPDEPDGPDGEGGP